MLNRTSINIAIVLLGFASLAWLFSDIVLYFVIALVLTSILKTPTNYISQTQIGNFRIPRVVAVLVSFGMLAAIIGLFVLIFKPLVYEQFKVVASMEYNDLITNFITPIVYLEDLLIEYKIVNSEEGFVIKTLKEKIFAFGDKFKVGDIINNVLSTTSGFFVGLMAVFFITFFLLFEKGILRRNIIALIPNAYFEVSIGAFYKIEKLLSNYLLGLLLQMLSIFTLTAFGLILGGIKYAITIAVFTAVAHLIPFLGAILGILFGLLVGLSTTPIAPEGGAYLLLTFKILAVFTFVPFMDNVILQPIIFSKSVKAHPLEIFLIVFVGATLAGAGGMVAAIPTYTIVKVSVVELYKGYKRYHIFRIHQTTKYATP